MTHSSVAELLASYLTRPSVAALITRNYRNLSSGEELRLGRLNIFIGPNGSGKSSAIAVLQFLKNCVVGTSDQSLFGTSLAKAAFELGGAGMCDRSLPVWCQVSFTYIFKDVELRPFQGDYLRLDLDLALLGFVDPVSIQAEKLSAFPWHNEPRYYYRFHYHKPGEGVVSIWDDETEGNLHYEELKGVPTGTLALSILHDLLESSVNAPERTPAYRVRRQLLAGLSTWQFYNANYMNLSLIRDSEPKVGPLDTYLSPGGENLALVVENLFQQDIDFEDRLNVAMRSILPQTRRIRPVRTGLFGTALQWHFNGVSAPFYLREMSDGTVRMLCWATILLSPRLPALIVIDEPEIGIHPAWMGTLATWIKRASEQTQVIVCTHSPDLLDHFTDTPESVVCFSSSDQRHFSAAPLSPEKLQEKLKEGWQLGDLYRVGDPAVGGWPW